jgi:hypothetical protein
LGQTPNLDWNVTHEFDFAEAEWTGCLGALYLPEVEMGKINWARVIICGIVAGLVWTVLTSLITAFFSKEFVAAVPGGRLTTPPHGMVAFLLVLNLLMGMWAMWLYAAIRPRYGPGMQPSPNEAPTKRFRSESRPPLRMRDWTPVAEGRPERLWVTREANGF